MDKNAIKKYAIWARNELIARIAQKALRYGISKDNIVDAYADSIDGVLLSAVEKCQRQALIAQIEAKGFEQVVEEVAYTWFNRFCALRFMEVNGYLPSNIRVLSDEGNNFKPDILTKAIELDFESLNMGTVYAFKEANKDEELYRYLLIVQCNELNKILPHMFQKLEDYTELLLPDNLLREGSVVEQLVTTIPQEDFDINQGGQIEIIGWLYQYYNTEPKAKTFELLKKNVKITKERIPSATQLFTPDWIVRYMVENSLGRIWVEGHPNDELKGNWKYYLDEAKQEEAVEAELAKIRAVYAILNPKDIKVMDPCMGSGHILVYAFDVLMQIYTSVGYTEKEASISILENNLYGLDIDERAFQLAYFAVMMKARQYHKFILKKQVQCNIHPIVESNGINVEQLHYFGVQLDEFSKNAAITQMQGLISQMHDAKEYGSIITVDDYDWELLREFLEEFDVSNGFNLFNANGIEATQQRLKELVAVGEVLAKKYEVVVTNPPYRAVSDLTAKVNEFIKNQYPESKVDLFAVFIERCAELTICNGLQAMITQHSWMFLSSFEKLRAKIINRDIVNMAHLGARAFEEIGGEVVQTTSFVFRNASLRNLKGKYCRLIDADSQNAKEEMYLMGINRYEQNAVNYSKIPGSPIAYWVSEKMFSTFDFNGLGKILTTREGMATADNDRFLRNWYEIEKNRFRYFNKDCNKWFPYNKGGSFRKWYGNRDYVVDWENDGYAIRNNKDIKTGRIRSHNYNGEYALQECLTWSALSSGSLSVRYCEEGFLWDSKGASGFSANSLVYCLGLLNSSVSKAYLEIFSPTMDFKVGDIILIPLVQKENDKVCNIVEQNIELSICDWDSFETSWDFKKHPLI